MWTGLVRSRAPIFRLLAALFAVAAFGLPAAPASAATCDNSWNTDSSGDWGTAANWGAGHVPTSAENVCIDRGAANPTITISADATAATLAAAEHLTLTGGTFRPAQGAAGSILSGDLDMTGGTLQLDQPIAVTGTTTWTGSALSGGGNVLTNGGTLVLAGAGNFTADAKILNTGTLRQDSAGTLTLNQSLTNQGTYDINGDGDVTGGQSFFNDGTVKKSSGSGTSIIGQPLNGACCMHVDGVAPKWNVQAGTLQIAAPATWISGGEMLTSAGATLRFAIPLNNGTNLSLAGNFTGSDGTVDFADGTVSAQAGGATLDIPTMTDSGARLTGSGTGLHIGGSLTVTAAVTMGTGVFNDSDGTIHQGASVAVNGSVTNNGLWDITANVGLTNGGNPAFTNAGTLRKSAGTGVSHIDAINFNGSGQGIDVQTGTLRTSSSGTWSGTTTMTVASGATFRFLRDADCCWTITLDGTVNGTGAGSVIAENGSLASGAAGATVNFAGALFQLAGARMFGGGGGVLHNAGRVNVTADSLFADKFTNDLGATVRQTAGAGINGLVTNAGTWDLAADVGLTNAGNPNFTSTGTLRKSGGTGESVLDDINFNATGHTIDVQTGTLTNRSASNWNGATITAASGAKFRWFKAAGGFTTTLSGSITGSGAGAVSVGTNASVVSGAAGATLNFPGGLFRLDGGLLQGAAGGVMHNAGTITVDSSSSLSDKFTNDAGATLRQAAGGALSFAGNVVNDGLWDFAADVNLTRIANGSFTSTGTVRKSGGTGESVLSDINWQATGQTIDVQTGTLTDKGSGTWNGTTTITPAAGTKFRWLNPPSCCVTTVINGSLTGSGAGAVALEGNSEIVSGASGATLSFPGALFRLDGGFMHGAAGGILHNAGTVTVVSSSSLSDRFTNDAGATVRQAAGGALSFAGNVVNDGLWDFAADVNLTRIANGGFTSTGTIRKSAGTGESVLDEINLTGTSQTIDVQTGTLTDKGGGTWNGTTTITPATGAKFRWLNPPSCCIPTVINGTLTGSGAGVVALEANSELNTGASGATLNFPGGLFRLDGGFMRGAAGGVLHNTGTITVESPSSLSDKFTNDAGATFRQKPAGQVFFAGNVTNNGLWDFAGDVNLTRTANGGFFSNGTVRKSAGNAETLLDDVNWTGTGQTIDVQTGTMRMNANGKWSGATAMTVAPAAAFRFFSATNCCWSFALEGTLTGSGGGSVLHDNGDLAGDTTSGTLNFPPGMFQHNGGTLYGFFVPLHNAGTIDLGGGHLSSNFTNDAGGTLRQVAGTTMAGNVTNAGLWDVKGDSGIIAIANNNLFNTGTLRKSGGTAISTVTSYLDNTGTVEARSGTLAVQASPQISGASLTGGTWKALTAGTLSFPNTFGIATNGATLVLDGSDARMPELSALSSNTGSLTVSGGATVTPAGNLTNAGTITLGRSSRLSPAGTFTQPGTGTLNVVIDGRPSTGRFGLLQAGGAATLGGTLAIDTGDDFSAVTDDQYRILRFASQTGNFATVTGLSISPSVAFTTLLNPTDFTLRVTPAGTTRADLQASDVVVTPLAGTLAPGQTVSVAFTVANRGDATNAQVWKDSVYLSADANFDLDDKLIARVEHTGNVPHGGEYDVNVSAPLPGVLPGTYRVIVVPDSRGLNPTVTKGSGTGASAPRDLVIPVITPGTPVNGTIAADQERYFQVSVPAGKDLAVTGSLGAANKGSVFFEDGDIPTESDYAAASIGEASPDVFLPGDGTARIVYIRLKGLPGAGAGQSFSLSAALITFGPRKVSPKNAGNTGPVTLTVDGSGFSAATQASLTGVGSPRNATKVAVINAHRLYATFDLTGATTGAYGLRLTDGGDDATLASALTVSSGGGTGSLTVTTEAPRYFRVGWQGFFTVRFRNAGSSDVGAPLIRVFGDAADVGLPGHGALGDQVGFLARVSEGPAGVIPPHGEGAQTIQFLDHDVAAHQHVHFHTVEIAPTDTKSFDWSSQKAGLKPPGMTNASWDTVFAHLLTVVGTTNGSYVRALQAAAEEAEGYGLDLATESELLAYLRDRAVVFAPGARVHGKLSRAGAPLRNAAIALTGADGEAYVAHTWFDGSYALWDIPAGTYELRVPSEGDDVLQTVTVLPAGSTLDIDTPDGAEINGGVFADDGDAVAGAHIVIRELATRRSYEATTDADGHFSRKPLPAATYQVLVDPPPGNAPPVPQFATVDANAGASLTFTLSDGGALQGVITDPAGAPVKDATVTITAADPETPFTVDATTDVTGTYHVDGLKPGDFHVTAVKAGLGGADRTAKVLDAVAVSADLALKVAGTITGTVTQDGSNTPIAGATVSTDAPGRGTPAVTGADGKFVVPQIPPGTHHMWVRASGRLPVSQPVTLAPGQTLDVPVSMHEANRISGTLQGAGGAPLAGERIALFQHDIAVGTVATGANGAFDFPKLADGDYTVGVGDGTDFSVGREDLTIAGAKPVLTISSPRSTVTGFVKQTGGAAVSGAVVQLFDGDQLLDTVQTLKTGAYSFTAAATGAYSVRAFAAGYGVSPAKAFTVDTLGPVVNVADLTPGAGQLTVAVADGAAAPVSGAIVTVSAAADNPGRAGVTALSAANGSAVLSGLPDGTYDVTVVATGKAPDYLTATVTGGTGTANAVVPSSGGLQGTITDANGPVAAAQVLAVDRSDGRPFLTSTGANGAYLIAGLPAGTYDVAVSAPGHRHSVDESVTVAAGPATTLSPVLAIAASVTVTVDDGAGHEVGAATGQLERRNGASNYRSVVFAGPSDPITGALALGALAPSSDYRLTLRRDGRETSQVSFTTDGGGAPVGLPGTVAAGTLRVLPALRITAASPPPPRTSKSQLPDALTFNTNPFGWFDWLDPSGLAIPERMAFDTPEFRYEWIQYAGGKCPPSGADLEAARVLSDQIEKSYQAWVEATRAAKDIGIANIQTYLANSTQIALKVATLVSGVKGLTKLPGLQGPALGVLDSMLNEAGTLMQNMASGGGAIGEGTPNALDQFLNLMTGQASFLEGLAEAGGVAGSAGIGAAGAVAAELAVLKNIVYDLGQLLDQIKTDNGNVLAHYMSTGDMYRKSLDKYAAVLARLRALDRDHECPPPPKPPDPPVPPTDDHPKPDIEGLRANDPNDIVGLPGVGDGNYLTPGTSPLRYTIHFENKADAGLPARTVKVTTVLDPDVDMSTFQLDSFGFGEHSVDVPAGRTTYTTRIDDSSVSGLLVEISGRLNTATRTVTWTFTSLDPLTGDEPADTLKGFLPQNVTTPEGVGYASYSVAPATPLPSGASVVIPAQASIVFDTNAAIATNTFLNGFDQGAPSVTVDPLPATTTSSGIPVTWSGNDDPGGSGIAFYDVLVSVDGGVFGPFQTHTTDRSATYNGEVGHSYAFIATATDLVGNVQAVPSAAQAQTAVVAAAPKPVPTGTPVPTVTPVLGARFLPDLLIGAGKTGKLVGNGLYGKAGVGQTITIKAKQRGKVKLRIVLQNDGRVADTIALRGPATKSGMKIAYKLGKKTVTKTVKSGKQLATALKPGGTVTFDVVISVGKAKKGKKFTLTIQATSKGQPTAVDVVRATIAVAKK
jgi:hypothetical protein